MEKSKIGIIAAACGGLAGGALLGAPLLTSASTPDTTPSTTTADTVDDTADTTTGDTTDTTTDTSTDDGNRRQGRAGGDDCRGGRGGHGRMGGHGPGLFLERGAIAELLGLEPEQLRERLRDGETIAEIATAEGLDPQDVIDTLVDEAQANLDERFAERSENLEERITDVVNGDR